MKAQLIEITSPKYLRRLVREINTILRKKQVVLVRGKRFGLRVVRLNYSAQSNCIWARVTTDHDVRGYAGDFFLGSNMEVIEASRLLWK
jgi:hypothetical protein